MHFKVGERVSFLHESGGGEVVRKVSDHEYVVLDETGFERPFSFNELVKIHGNQEDVYNELVTFIPDDEEEHRANRKVYTVDRRKDFWEIDLHTHALLPTEQGMNHTEMLNIQMSEFRAFYRQAREKFIKKLVVIYGVGEGVLKNEVRDFLSTQEGVSFFDADYRNYGKGATEINIIYNFKQNKF